jgi:hypothetical protein
MGDTYDRVAVEPGWPNGGYMVTKPLDQRNYDVQQVTGYSVSTVPAGGWVRGQTVRLYQPEFRPSTLGYYAYDPTDPTSWMHNGG